ncbi:MAG: Asp23/Gls24 family envelope stress response protein [Clostridia bacterium]|nr:Asp23/Gls24 family envelope stress response protein [Clostridia bacterium]
MVIFMISYETVLGKVSISEAYLTKLIGSEVTSCYGVVGMVPSNNRQKISKFISKGAPSDTGISVRGDANSIDVEIHIEVIYGINISATANSITEKVKYVVKQTTDIDVNRVVVKIDGIKE